MLTALAPGGLVAPAVPPSPPSATCNTQPAQRESFRDIYRNVPNGDGSQSDAGPKQKTADSTDTKPKKSGSDDGNDKTPVVAIPPPQGPVLQKAPLVFALPSLGLEVASQPVSDKSASASENKPQPTTQSAGDASIGGRAIPDFSLGPIIRPSQTLATQLVPANEKLAFSARLTQPDASPLPVQAPRLSIPQPSRFQTSNEARVAAGPASAPAAKDAYQTVEVKKAGAPETILPTREIPSASVLDIRGTTSPPQFAEPVHATPSRSIAIQDVQPTLPEIPKPPASTEILLQLAGKDQSTASVRVVDRSGTVNVTVHAADPELRNSLRSNLGDLASQLTGQGFKTEVIKPAVIAANAENQHDSRQSSQDSPSRQQHHSPQDSHLPQRDRRANSERWLDELEQETSGTPGTTGGKS